MASSSAGPSMSPLAAPPFTPSASPSLSMQQHARTMRKPIRSSPLAGPVLSRSQSQSYTQESEEPTPPELNETERMIALNVHGAFDSRDALKSYFLAPPRPAHIRGSHSRSLQEISRLRPRPVSLYSAPVMGRNTVRNHRRSFMGLDAERARDAEEQALGQRHRSLPALGETEGPDEDQAHESEEDWGPGQARVEAKYNSDHNSVSMKLKNSASRTDMKSLPTQARPKSILLTPPSSSLSQSIYSYSPSPSSLLSSSSSPPVSPNSTSTSLSLHSTSPRSGTSFLSLPPTSPTGDAIWLTQNTYDETPKFTRLGLGAPGVVMPVSAKAKAKPLKTLSTATLAPTAASSVGPEPKVPAPASSTLSKRNSFMASLSASIGRQRSLSFSNTMLQISEHGQQPAEHTTQVPYSAGQASVLSGNDRNINANYDTPHVLVEADDETLPFPASSSAPHTTAIAAPSGTAPPKSAESISSLPVASSNSQSPSQASSEMSSPTCSSLPPSPTPSLTRSSSASSSASSLPIQTPPPEPEVFPLAPLSRLKEKIAQVREDSPHFSSEAPAIAITDADVARALENAQRTETINNNLGSSRRRSRLGLRLGCSLERVKSWTTAPSPAKNGDTVPRNDNVRANASASISSSTPTLPATAPALHPGHASSKSGAAASVTQALTESSSGSVVAATPPLTPAPCPGATVMETGLQSISTTDAPPPFMPAGEAVSSGSDSGLEHSIRSKKLTRPFSQALVEESESSGDEDEAATDSDADLDRFTTQRGNGGTSIEAGELRRSGNSDRVQQENGFDSCHVRTQTLPSHNLVSTSKEKSPIPRSQSETAMLAQPSKAILAGDARKVKKARLEKSEKVHGRRSSVRRVWDALMHRNSSKRNGLS